VALSPCAACSIRAPRQKDELRYASRGACARRDHGRSTRSSTRRATKRWYADTPDDFVFAVKGGRFLTHNKKLRDCEGPLANFFASECSAGRKARPDPLAAAAAARLRRQADGRVHSTPARTTAAAAEAGGATTTIASDTGAISRCGSIARCAYAFRWRHESFVDPGFIRLLRPARRRAVRRRHGGALAVSEDVTTDFAYVRLHGAKRLLRERIRPRRARRLGRAHPAGGPAVATCSLLRQRREGAAPFDAMNLAARLGTARRCRSARRPPRRRGERGVEVPARSGIGGDSSVALDSPRGRPDPPRPGGTHHATGSCGCGAVRYEFTRRSSSASLSLLEVRKSHGAAFATSPQTREEGVRIHARRRRAARVPLVGGGHAAVLRLLWRQPLLRPRPVSRRRLGRRRHARR